MDPRAELNRARITLVTAELIEASAERYLTAHLAVGQVAAVVLQAWPGGPRMRRNCWQLVAEAAPEFGEWAGYFHAIQGKREAVEVGATMLVSSREADDLVRDGHTFADLVEERLTVRMVRARRSDIHRSDIHRSDTRRSDIRRRHA